MKKETKEANRKPKKTLEFCDLCVFTSTKYGEDEISKIRYPLFLKMMENCKTLGIKLIIADSSTNIDFLDNIHRIRNENIKVIKNDERLGKKRREALKDGILDKNIKYFLWIEPEKYDLIKKDSLNNMVNELRSGNFNIIIPNRNNIDQMPDFFVQIEKKGNKKIKDDVLNSELEYDLWFGPKMFDRKGAKYFLKYNKESNKADLRDSQILPVINAYKDGLKIQSVDTNFSYDKSEINIETISKELKQKREDQYHCIFSEISKV